MKIRFTLILLVITISIKSQTYYDGNFHKLKDRFGARYYTLIDTTQDEIIEKTYQINDTLFELVHYAKSENKVRQGKTFKYYNSGKLKYEIDYNNNRLNGYLYGYFENGSKKRVDYYKNDTLIEGKCFTENGSDTSYYIYEKNASYKGQNFEEGFRRFVMSKVKYPPYAFENEIQGKVLLEFCVNTKGEVIDIFVLESPSEVLSKAAIDAVSKSDLWEPAIFEGKKAKQKFTIPIIFSFK